MKSGLHKLLLCLLTCGLAGAAASQEPATVLSSGHHPVSIRYEADELHAFIAGSHGSADTYDPQTTVMHLTPASQLSIPSAPRFSFLGDSGSPVWIAPHVENPAILQLGFGGAGIPDGTFTGDRLRARLESVEGPGNFFIYEIDSGGGVTVRIDTADGIGQDDVLPFSTDGHDHQNWAFDAAGHYSLTWIVEGTLENGTAIASLPIEIRYAVGDVDPLQSSGPVIIDEGDADIATLLEGDRIILESFWGLTETAYAPSETVYRIKANSRIAVPMDEAYSFLGEAGSTVWVGPQSEVDGKIYLAMAADNFPAGVVESDRIEVRLVSFEGPGEFALYETDSFGLPVVNYSTADGLDESDLRVVTATEHSHLNWAFTAPGTYTIRLQATAVRSSDGEPLSSDITTFSFEVVPPVIIDEGDADIATLLEGDRIILESFWGLTETAYAPSETVYRIKANSRIAVPMDEAYSFLGEAGSTVWVGPQSEVDGKIYLAMAADNFPAGVVESDRIEVRLVSFEGPGEFALYETDSFGLPVVNYSTADGLDESDLRVVTATEHSHLNWAFTAPGTYTIRLQATAVRASDGEPLSSDITTFSFEVVPPIRTRLTLDGPAAVVLVWEGTANSRYIIQGTTDIAEAEWQSLSEPISGMNGTMTRTVDITNQTTGFLRVVEILE